MREHVDVERQILRVLCGAHERHFGAMGPGYVGNSASSVETIVRVTRRDFRACSIECAINGFPPTGMTFLRGIPFEPPRAGTTARISRPVTERRN